MSYENIEGFYTEIPEGVYPDETLRINIDSLNGLEKSQVSIKTHCHSSRKNRNPKR